MGEKEWAPTDVFDLLGDRLTRRILVIASDEPLSADEAATILDASPPTIYRRFNALSDYDLVKEEQQIDTKGNHYKTYETTLNKVVLEIEDGGFNIDLQIRRNLVDQFGEMWNELGKSSPNGSVEQSENSNQVNHQSDTPHG